MLLKISILIPIIISISQAITILPLGNSITRGLQYGTISYRSHLKDSLNFHGIQSDFIGSKSEGPFLDNQHEGHGGWIIATVPLSHIYPCDNSCLYPTFFPSNLEYNKKYGIADSFAYFKSQFIIVPNCILLEIGTNDIARLTEYTSKTGERYKRLMDTLARYSSSSTIFAASLPPLPIKIDTCNCHLGNINDSVKVWNRILKDSVALWASKGRKVLYVEMHDTTILRADIVSNDGIHPTAIGNKKIASIWTASLRGLYQQRLSIPQIITPSNGAVLSKGNPIEINVSMGACPDTVKVVEFFVNGKFLKAVRTPPFKSSWTPSDTGTHNLTAWSIGKSGAYSQMSALTTVIVSSSSSVQSIQNKQKEKLSKYGLYCVFQKSRNHNYQIQKDKNLILNGKILNSIKD